MRSALRNYPPLAVLTATAGWVDAVAYLDLGHVFTANQTGNSVLLAAALACRATGTPTPGLSPLRALTALAGFCAGLAAGSLAAREPASPAAVRDRLTAPRALAVLTAEAALLFAVALARQSGALTGHSPVPVVVVSLAMGLQSAYATHVGVGGVTTTVVTGTLATFFHRLTGAPERRGGALVALLTWLAYFAGAGLGTLLLTHRGQSAYWPPAAAVTAVAITLRHRGGGRPGIG